MKGLLLCFCMIMSVFLTNIKASEEKANDSTFRKIFEIDTSSDVHKDTLRKLEICSKIPKKIRKGKLEAFYNKHIANYQDLSDLFKNQVMFHLTNVHALGIPSTIRTGLMDYYGFSVPLITSQSDWHFISNLVGSDFYPLYTKVSGTDKVIIARGIETHPGRQLKLIDFITDLPKPSAFDLNMIKTIMDDDIENLQTLLSRNVYNIDRSIDVIGMPILPLSALCGSSKCFKFLWLHDALRNPDFVLTMACLGNNYDIIHLVENEVNMESFNFFPILQLCALTSSIEVFSYLVNNNPDKLFNTLRNEEKPDYIHSLITYILSTGNIAMLDILKEIPEIAELPIRNSEIIFYVDELSQATLEFGKLYNLPFPKILTEFALNSSSNAIDSRMMLSGTYPVVKEFYEYEDREPLVVRLANNGRIRPRIYHPFFENKNVPVLYQVLNSEELRPAISQMLDEKEFLSLKKFAKEENGLAMIQAVPRHAVALQLLLSHPYIKYFVESVLNEERRAHVNYFMQYAASNPDMRVAEFVINYTGSTIFKKVMGERVSILNTFMNNDALWALTNKPFVLNNINAKMPGGVSPFIRAMTGRSGYPLTMRHLEELKRAGADFRYLNPYSNGNLFHIVALNATNPNIANNIDAIIDFLLKEQVDILWQDNNGKTAADHAVSNLFCPVHVKEAIVNASEKAKQERATKTAA